MDGGVIKLNGFGLIQKMVSWRTRLPRTRLPSTMDGGVIKLNGFGLIQKMVSQDI